MQHMLPRLTQALAPLTCPVQAVNEHGQTEDLSIPAERALTVYVDKRELVTLMTLGAHPEWLVLGYLRNQRLIDSVDQIESITVDWTIGEGEMGEPGVAAVAEIARQWVAPIVSLYVNDYNAVARRCYEAVGFRAAGEFATVLL